MKTAREKEISDMNTVSIKCIEHAEEKAGILTFLLDTRKILWVVKE